MVLLEMRQWLALRVLPSFNKFKIPLSTLNQKIKRLQIDIKRHRDN